MPGQPKIIVGLWGATDRVAEATKRLHDSGADETVISLAAAMQQITTLRRARTACGRLRRVIAPEVRGREPEVG